MYVQVIASRHHIRKRQVIPMTNLVEQLRLIERAREDIHFARIDRELIAALHAQARRAAKTGVEKTEKPGPAPAAEIPSP
jgi:hypothetical protein